MQDSRLMNNIMYGCARAYNAIHQSHVLDNVRAVFPNRINTFAGMQCSATRKCKSFAQTLPFGGSGNQTNGNQPTCPWSVFLEVDSRDAPWSQEEGTEPSRQLPQLTPYQPDHVQ